MFCSECHTQNTATAVRCLQCGKTLIFEAEGHSEAYKSAERLLDDRMYSGIGAFLGFVLCIFLLKFILADFYFDDRQIYGGAAGAALACGLLGRLYVWWKWKWQ
jgi:hypothetical protein